MTRSAIPVPLAAPFSSKAVIAWRRRTRGAMRAGRCIDTPSRRSADPNGELVAAALVDGERLGQVAVGGVTNVVEIVPRERVLAEDHSSARQPGLDQLEHRQVE